MLELSPDGTDQAVGETRGGGVPSPPSDPIDHADKDLLLFADVDLVESGSANADGFGERFSFGFDKNDSLGHSGHEAGASMGVRCVWGGGGMTRDPIVLTSERPE